MLLLFLASLPVAAETTPIDPFTIAQSGNYQVTQDLICPTAAAITTLANDVRLDLAGHTLDGPGAMNTNHIGIALSGVTQGTIMCSC